MGSKLDCQEVWSSYLPGPDRVKDNVLSAPVFLEPRFAPAPYQKKRSGTPISLLLKKGSGTPSSLFRKRMYSFIVFFNFNFL